MTENPTSEPPPVAIPAAPDSGANAEASVDEGVKLEPNGESAPPATDAKDKGKEPADQVMDEVSGGDGDNPTTETLREAEAHLQELMQRKRQTERSLASLENQIYKFETSYLEDTGAIGNIVKGFDGYVNMQRGATKQKQKVAESDRVFSRSSTTYEQSIAHIREKEARQEQMKKHRLSSEGPLMSVNVAAAQSTLSSMQQQQMLSPNQKKKKKRWSGADEDYR
ncbi:NuA4-domain-containing protein [Gonapodya prolifera JEL478]|uniref:Chromatin modification-related protein EAF6 n=1 Tax=Gonapodya prolifera (strain JEL478) TaxID=1344416 RepID=A0A139AZM1_GONPJ|nr:NuA4-domain-containing protein [Gonapodya prolifera JEL478]|eukprot:KXS22157.1 NuA4-domain-containing protein [Gonapodya prolifera JEL478]